MSVLQRLSLYPSERFDIPDARMIDAAAINDWRYFLQGVFSETPYILSGFEITNYANIFSLQGVKIQQNNVVVFYPTGSSQATGFYVSSGTESDATPNLNPSATNFLELDFTAVSGTPDVRAFWDSGTQAEYTDTVDTIINLTLDIILSTSGFTTGKIPLYKITTDSNGLVTSVTDCRPLFFRLGTGGVSPNPNNTFTYPSLPDSTHAQFENPVTSSTTAATSAPFQGGDKGITTFKNWMDAVMTSLMTNRAVPYWYVPSISQTEIYQNSAMTLLVGGTWVHDSGTAGYLTLTGGSTVYRFGRNNNCGLGPFSHLNMNANPVLFILLPKDTNLTYRMGQDAATPIAPKAISTITASSIRVSATTGNYITNPGTTPAQLLIRGQAFTYSAYDGTTGTFTGVYPDPSGLAQAGDLVFQESLGANGFYHYGTSAQVPGMIGGVSEGAERSMWLVYFDGANMHTATSELLPGEQINVGDNTSQNIMTYTGMTSDADSTPIYGVHSVTDGTNLTSAISTAFQIIETPIYDESATGTFTSGAIVNLPPNSRAGNAPGLYTIGTGELEVYDSGLLLQAGQDYTEASTNAIQLSRDLSFDSVIRFRIASIGGAGAAAGTAITGETLQNAYQNGTNIVTNPSSPVVIDGTNIVLHVKEAVQIDGITSNLEGLNFKEQTSDPFSSTNGLWVDSSDNLQFTQPSGTIIPISQTVQAFTGNNQAFTRTYLNSTGASIPAGSTVYISAAGVISLASCSGPTTYRFLGVTSSTIANGSSGAVIYSGVAAGIFSGMGLTSGQYVWLGSTSGSFTTSAPTVSGSYKVILGLIDGNDLILQPQFNGQVP